MILEVSLRICFFLYKYKGRSHNLCNFVSLVSSKAHTLVGTIHFSYLFGVMWYYILSPVLTSWCNFYRGMFTPQACILGVDDDSDNDDDDGKTAITLRFYIMTTEKTLHAGSQDFT